MRLIELNIAFLIVMILPPVGLSCQVIMNYPEDTVILKPFFLIETEVGDAMPYINSDLSDHDYKEYRDDSPLPISKPDIKRMYIIRSQFLINRALQKKSVSIYIGPKNYPYDFFLNGKLIHKSGSYDTTYNSTIFSAYNILLPNDMLKYGDEKNEIALKIVTWYNENTSLGNLTLSSFYKNSNSVFWRNLFYIHIVQAAVFVTFLIAIYFIFLFILGGRREMKYLYFILLCISFFLSCYNISFFNDSSSEFVNERIAKTGTVLSAMFLTLFLMETTEILNRNKWIKIALGVIGTVSASVIILSKNKIELNTMFNMVANSFIIVLFVINLILLCIGVFKKKQISTRIIFIAFLVILAASVHDIYYINTNPNPYTWLNSYGFCFMVLSIFVIMARDQVKVARESLERSEELKKVNVVQTKIISDVESVSDNLTSSSTQLERIIEKSIKVIEKYGSDNAEITKKAIDKFDGLEQTIGGLKKRISDFSERISSSIQNQTAIVEEFTASFTSQTSHLETVIHSVTESATMANNLASIANTSSNVVVQSKKSIERLSDYSIFLNNVLTVLGDVVDRTNLLSINAAIEAVRAGVIGKGFNVVALEIRKLASQSKENLESSLVKIRDMYSIIGDNKKYSDDVSQSLYSIIDGSNESAKKVNAISELIRDQQKEFTELLGAVESLLRDTLMIKDISEKEKAENESINITLTEIKDTFYSITQMLRGQNEREKELYSHLEKLKEVMNENLRNVGILKDSVVKR
jgi:methyl-accepting chemotaxis protein